MDWDVAYSLGLVNAHFMVSKTAVRDPGHEC